MAAPRKKPEQKRTPNPKKRSQSAKQNPIHIKPENQGKMRAQTSKTQSGNIKQSELEKKKRSSDPKTRKRAVFALNAKKWNKKKS